MLTSDEIWFINTIKEQNFKKANELITATKNLIQPIIEDLSGKESCICLALYVRHWNDILTCWTELILNWVSLTESDTARFVQMVNKIVMDNS